MNKNIDKNNLNDVISLSKKILKVFYILLIVIGAYISLKIIKELGIINIILNILKILAPLFIGIVIAWLFNPFIKWLENKKVRRIFGVTLSYVILAGCIILFIQAIIPLLYNQTIDLVENIPNIFTSVKNWLGGIFSNVSFIENFEKSLISNLDKFSTNLTTTLPSLIINSISSIISYIGTFVIGLVIGFFLLLSYDNLSNVFIGIIPKKIRKTTNELIEKINTSLRNYVNGAFLDSMVVFLVSTIAFAVIGLKSPVLFGLFCGLMNVIPYVGPYIGGAPAVIVAFSQGFHIGIVVLAAIVIIQLIEGNVLQTLIISKTTKLNPVIIIIGLLIFGHFFGIIGMLLSTPIIGVGKVVIKYFDEKYDIFNFK